MSNSLFKAYYRLKDLLKIGLNMSFCSFSCLNLKNFLKNVLNLINDISLYLATIFTLCNCHLLLNSRKPLKYCLWAKYMQFSLAD